MRKVTLYKGHYPARQCLENKRLSISFEPGDAGLLVDIGAYQMMIPFDVVAELSDYTGLVYLQYPTLRPDKTSG